MLKSKKCKYWIGIIHSVGDYHVGLLLDAADSHSVVVESGNSGIAFLAPVRASSVSHDVEVLSAFGTPADNVDGVVRESFTLRTVDDATLVLIEDASCLNCHCNYSSLS